MYNFADQIDQVQTIFMVQYTVYNWMRAKFGLFVYSMVSKSMQLHHEQKFVYIYIQLSKLIY